MENNKNKNFISQIQTFDTSARSKEKEKIFIIKKES